MTTDSGFDMERHRQWLAGLSTPDLQQHTARLDPSQQPEAWRAAVEELSRRGIVFTQQPPHAAYPPQYAYPPQPPYPTAYPAPPAGARKKGSIPLGVRMGCMGCLGMAILMCVLMAVGFGIIVDMLPEMMTEDFHTINGSGWFGLVYQSEGSFLSAIKQETGRKKPVRFQIFENGQWRDGPAPGQNGSMAVMGNKILLLGESGESTLPLDASGRPTGGWSEPKPIEGVPLRCPKMFIHNDTLYYLFEVKGIRSQRGAAGEPGETVLYNRTASRIETEHPIIDWLSENETSVCELRVLEHEGVLYVFEPGRDRRSSKSSLNVHIFKNNIWNREQVPLTFMGGNAFEAGIIDNAVTVFAMNINLDEITPGKILRNGGQGLESLEVMQYHGGVWAPLPDVPFKQERPMFFNPASDGGHDYLVMRRTLAKGFDVLQLDELKWKYAHTAPSGFSPAGLMKNPIVIALSLVFIGLIVLITFISSIMITKERGCEMLLYGQTVAVPTLWRRFAAFAIDFSLFYLPFIIAGVLMSGKFLEHSSFNMASPEYLLSAGLRWIGWLVFMVYMALAEGLWGRTLGKKLMRLRVVREDLTRCGIGWAALRNVLRILDGMFYYAIGGIVFAHTDKFQRVGDLAAKTVVVMDAPALPLPPGSVPPAPPPIFNAPPPQTPYNPADFAPPQQ